MRGGLVEQLLEAGLVTEAQARGSQVRDPLVSPRRAIQDLIDQGLDERILAGFFVSKGYGPMLQARELARADVDLVRQISGADAHDFCIMPLRPSAAGAVVAMANPTDEEAVAKLTLALGGHILPTVAKLSDLLVAIDREYPPNRPTLVSDAVALARSRPPSGVMPLVQEKEHEFPDLASTASPVWDRAWKRSATERDVSLTPKASEIPLHALSHPSSVAPVRDVSHPPTAAPRAVSDSMLDTQLDGLRHVETRDDAVRVACEACVSVARGAAFLALRKGVFRGWDGAGEDVTSASIRSLWVPASNPSSLNEVLHTGKPFRGAYGQTAADHLFRAAFGSHGREVVIVPVVIGSRMVGALCANDPTGDTAAVERVADALGQAFQRLIVSHKART